MSKKNAPWCTSGCTPISAQSSFELQTGLLPAVLLCGYIQALSGLVVRFGGY